MRESFFIVLAVAATASGPIPCYGDQETRPPRTVLAIHWGAEDFLATPDVNRAIREALVQGQDQPVDYFAEYLESDLFPEDQVSPALAEYIRRKYRGRHFDVVIANTAPALQFVINWRDTLFPGVPVVFLGGRLPDWANSIAGDLTAVTRGPAYSNALKLALRLHPGTDRVFVIAKSGSRLLEEAVDAEMSAELPSISITYINEPTVARLLQAVEAVPPQSLILYIWHRQEDPGVDMTAREIARLVVGVARVPVYGTSEDYIGQGVIGSVARGMRETGTRVGQVARQILSGVSPGDIPMEYGPLVTVFDWRELRRWGIDASRLPEGARIAFREPTIWESYRSYVVGIITVISLQLLLIGALAMQRARRRGTEKTLVQREDTLRTSYERIRQLHRRLINAQEEARAEVARELHDGVCQELVGLSMAVGRLRRGSGDLRDDSSQEALRALQDTANGVVDGIRRLSHDLHPATLRLIGLAAALRGHCIEVEQRHDLQVSFTSWGNLEHIPADIALCLFRIAQEALRNAAVHGEPRRLTVALARVATDIHLTVRDDGHGFDFDEMSQHGGLGLVSLEERAHIVGGTVRIVSSGAGTTVRVCVPLGDRTIVERGAVSVS